MNYRLAQRTFATLIRVRWTGAQKKTTRKRPSDWRRWLGPEMSRHAEESELVMYGV